MTQLGLFPMARAVSATVWAGVVKSALQKHVRRGESSQAVRCAAEMLRQDRGDFLRRWPIIVAEDVLPAVRLLPGLAADPLGTVAASVALSKNKDAWGVALAMQAQPTIVSYAYSLAHALADGDPVVATHRAYRLWTEGNRATVRGELVKAPGVRELLRCVDTMRYDNSQIPFMLAAAVLCAMHRVASVTVSLPVVPPCVADVAPRDAQHVAWYACDAHTAPGGMAVRALAKTESAPVETIKTLWFWLESAQLGGAVADHAWYTVDDNLRAEGVDPRGARDQWARWQPLARTLVEWACEKHGIVAGDVTT